MMKVEFNLSFILLLLFYMKKEGIEKAPNRNRTSDPEIASAAQSSMSALCANGCPVENMFIVLSCNFLI